MMAVLSAAQIASLVNKHWQGEDRVIAVAVFLAESGGRTDAVNRNTNGSTDRGIAQINSVHAARIAGRDLNNPAVNVQIAYEIWSDKRSWSPWSTFKAGRHQKYMAIARLAVAAPNNTPIAGVVSGEGMTKKGGIDFGPITRFFEFIGNAENWFRVAMFAGGVIAATLGIALMLKESPAVQAGVRAVAAKLTRGASEVIA